MQNTKTVKRESESSDRPELSKAQLRFLRNLEKLLRKAEGVPSGRELAEQMGITPSMVSKRLNELETAGYLRRGIELVSMNGFCREDENTKGLAGAPAALASPLFSLQTSGIPQQ